MKLAVLFAFAHGCADEPRGPRSTPAAVPVDAGPRPRAPTKEPEPLDLGPDGALNRGGRVAAVLDLVSGKTPASSFPVYAGDSGESLDTVRQRLAPLATQRDPPPWHETRAKVVQIQTIRGPRYDTEAAEAKLQAGNRGLGHCVQPSFDGTRPEPPGRASLEFTIEVEPAGRVSNAVATSAGNAPYERCLERAARGTLFDPPVGAPVTLRLTIVPESVLVEAE